MVADCMSEQVVCLHPNESVARIEWVLCNTTHNGFPVVTPPTKGMKRRRRQQRDDTATLLDKAPCSATAERKGRDGGGGGGGGGNRRTFAAAVAADVLPPGEGGSGGRRSGYGEIKVVDDYDTDRDDAKHDEDADEEDEDGEGEERRRRVGGLDGTAAADGGGRLIGIVLRSQLMVLLARRAFVELVAPPPTVPVWRFPPFGFEPLVGGGGTSPRETSGADRPTEEEAEVAAAAEEDSLHRQQELLLTGGGGGGGVSGALAVTQRHSLKRAARGVTGFIQGVASRASRLVDHSLGIGSSTSLDIGRRRQGGIRESGRGGVVEQTKKTNNDEQMKTKKNATAPEVFVSRNSSLHSLLPDDDTSDEDDDTSDETQEEGSGDASSLRRMVRRWGEGARGAAGDARGDHKQQALDVSAVLSDYFTDYFAERFPGRADDGDEALKEQRALEAYYDAIDTDMRTFHHRQSFHDRSISVSKEAVARLGLTQFERGLHCDLASFMKIAPLSVQSQCSAWRALGYFRSVGLRHLPVVDETNVVLGMLTRGDLILNIRAAEAAAAAAAEAEAAAAAEAALAAAAAGNQADDGALAMEDVMDTWLGRSSTPLPTSAGPRRALTGDELFQTVHL